MRRCFAQIIEKRIIKKLVPKMVEVEEEYEYEVGLTGARARDKPYRRCSCSDAPVWLPDLSVAVLHAL